jgi:hypothetical protein
MALVDYLRVVLHLLNIMTFGSYLSVVLQLLNIKTFGSILAFIIHGYIKLPEADRERPVNIGLLVTICLCYTSVMCASSFLITQLTIDAPDHCDVISDKV